MTFIEEIPDELMPKSPPPNRKSFLSVLINYRGEEEDEDDTEKGTHTPKITEILSDVWPRLEKGGRLTLVGGYVAAVIHAVATPVFAYCFAQLLATFHKADSFRLALIWASAILVIALIDGLATYAFHFLFDASAQIGRTA